MSHYNLRVGEKLIGGLTLILSIYEYRPYRAAIQSSAQLFNLRVGYQRTGIFAPRGILGRLCTIMLIIVTSIVLVFRADRRHIHPHLGRHTLTASLSQSIVPTAEYLNNLPEYSVVLVADASGVPISPPRIYVKDGDVERDALVSLSRKGQLPDPKEQWATVGFLGRSTAQEVVEWAADGTILLLDTVVR